MMGVRAEAQMAECEWYRDKVQADRSTFCSAIVMLLTCRLVSKGS